MDSFGVGRCFLGGLYDKGLCSETKGHAQIIKFPKPLPASRGPGEIGMLNIDAFLRVSLN